MYLAIHRNWEYLGTATDISIEHTRNVEKIPTSSGLGFEMVKIGLDTIDVTLNQVRLDCTKNDILDLMELYELDLALGVNGKIRNQGYKLRIKTNPLGLEDLDDGLYMEYLCLTNL